MGARMLSFWSKRRLHVGHRRVLLLRRLVGRVREFVYHQDDEVGDAAVSEDLERRDVYP